MSLALSACVLLISLNGEQFLTINFLLALFAAAGGTALLLTVIVPLTWIYASL